MTDRGPIYRLIYVSRNDLGGDVPEMEREVLRILDRSRANNRRDGITGALLFSESCFAQALEGSEDAVDGVFERIQRDPRHSETVVLECGKVAAREFGDWSMAYAGRVAESEARYGALAGEAGAPQASARIMDLLRDTLRRSGAA